MGIENGNHTFLSHMNGINLISQTISYFNNLKQCHCNVIGSVKLYYRKEAI